MKRFSVVTLVMSLFIFLPVMVFGQSAKDAVMALKKLEARIQIGISFEDYRRTLGDARFELNILSESPEAKSREELVQSLGKVMTHYITAGQIFEGIVSKLGSLPTVIDEKDSEHGKKLDKPYVEITQSILKAYPETSAAVSNRRMNMEEAMKIIWQKASNELKKATTLLNKK